MSLLTLGEVCKRLRLCERKVRQLVADRQIAVIRMGRTLRFEESAIKEFLETVRVPALRSVRSLPSALPDDYELDELVRKHGLG